MLARLVTALAIAGTLAALAASTAGATVQGITGGYVTGSAYCWDSNRILATTPLIYPAANAPFSLVGGGQDVGFQALLQRWDGARWVNVRVSSLQTQFAGYTHFDGELWLDTATNTRSIGTVWFSMSGLKGYFRVAYRLYWYLDGRLTGFVQADAWGHFDVRQSTFGVPGATSYDWCLY